MSETPNEPQPPEENGLINLAKTDDIFLHEVVRLADIGISQGVTLFVGGAIVSGTVISAEMFFTELADQISSTRAVGDDEHNSVIQRIEENYRTFAAASRRRTDVPEGYEHPPRRFIHLRRSAVIHGTEQVPTDRSLLWRGRISAVDAFSPTELTISVS